MYIYIYIGKSIETKNDMYMAIDTKRIFVFIMRGWHQTEYRSMGGKANTYNLPAHFVQVSSESGWDFVRFFFRNALGSLMPCRMTPNLSDAANVIGSDADLSI